MAGIGHPVVRVLEDIEQTPLRHPQADSLLEGIEACRQLLGLLTLKGPEENDFPIWRSNFACLQGAAKGA